MNSTRRNVLKATVAGGALATFGLGFSETAAKLSKGAWAGEKPDHRVYGNAPQPEFRIDLATGELEMNPDQGVSYTMCLGCTTLCGVRVRYDKKTGAVIRVAGNPYSPLSSDPTVPYNASIRESFVAVSRKDESGLLQRSTACGRGNAVLENMTSPFRVTQPLKRVGPRNGGRWEPISFEQLVEEVVEGGDLFGEGQVEGLRTLRDLKTPIDPAQPEFGARVNQVVLIDSVDDGRRSFAQRFLKSAYGSNNYAGHGGYCGGAYRSGSGAMFGDFKKMPHAKPDFDNAEFIIFIGTAPANAGNPFKRQGAQLARARSDGSLNYVVVDPVLNHSDNMATADRGRWVPIRPGTDGALVMGMIRWIIENERYDATYLAQPSAKAAEAAGEASWSNATHLVVRQDGHPRDGRFLRGSDLGVAMAEEARYGKDDAYVVVDAATGAATPHVAAGPATLFFDGTVETPNGPVRVATSLALLKSEAFTLDLAGYSEICGVPVETIAGLAKEFTSHGKKAATNAHGGMMAANGFYNAYAVVMLNTLIGNLNRKGGTVMKGGKHPDAGKGPRYDLAAFPGIIEPKGVPLSRGIPYEKSSEFKRKKEAGKPYPAEAPWHPNAPNLASEWMTAMFNGYPYPAKALILWQANPLYGVAGLRNQIGAALADPKKVPLVVAVDAFINETGAYADYIVPDAFMYEAWGWAAPWHGVVTKVTTGRWPVVESRNLKLADGRPVTMETFFIEVAKRLGLPGFGAGAIPDVDGNLHPLARAEDYYLRGGANVAFAGKQAVPDASDDDLDLSGVSRIAPVLQETLKSEEWRKVAYVLARGGRYQSLNEAFEGEKATVRFDGPMLVYNEQLATSRNALTGKRFPGTPAWTPAGFADGTPVRQIYPEAEWPFQIVSFKSPLQNSYSIGAKSLRRIHQENQVILHEADAERLGIAHGDRVRITTPGGSGVGRAMVRRGIVPGVVAIEHGFGHRELGARAHRIGDVEQPTIPGLSAGLNLNDMGLTDPTRKGLSVFMDPVSGSVVRQGLPARVEQA